MQKKPLSRTKGAFYLHSSRAREKCEGIFFYKSHDIILMQPTQLICHWCLNKKPFTLLLNNKAVTSWWCMTYDIWSASQGIWINFNTVILENPILGPVQAFGQFWGGDDDRIILTILHSNIIKCVCTELFLLSSKQFAESVIRSEASQPYQKGQSKHSDHGYFNIHLNWIIGG